MSEKRSPPAPCTSRDPRRADPWSSINCTALPENLLESELFGHVRGAFTGAVQNRIGRFEQAHGGTIFLDEIGDLPMELQAKLLRVLQEREFQRLGSSETVRVDVRVVAATNCDLEQRIEQGRFREDLLLPSQCGADPDAAAAPPVAATSRCWLDHFVEKVCRAEGIAPKSLSPEAVARLAGYSWPGNVRQLENAIEMAVALERRPARPARFGLPARLRLRAIRSAGLPSAPVSRCPTAAWTTSERSRRSSAASSTGARRRPAAIRRRRRRCSA